MAFASPKNTPRGSGKPLPFFSVPSMFGSLRAKVPWLCRARNNRHTTACHLLRAGVDINTIRAWLGHASLATTNIYAEIDLETKDRAISCCALSEPEPATSWKDDQRLMEFLQSL